MKTTTPVFTPKTSHAVSPNPRVSVVIPLHNKRKTIKRTIDSIARQTLENFKVIIIDDGSTDGGGRFAAAYPDRRVTVYAQPNAGPGAARNRGLALSRTEFITFLDADDEWMPEFLETAINCLDRHPDCGAFTAAYTIRYQGRSEIGGRPGSAPPSGPSRLSASPTRRDVSWCLADLSPCSSLYRTDVVQAQGGYFAENRCTYAEDVWLWIQIRLREAIYCHAQPLAYYHQDDSELGIAGRNSALPLEPVFTHVDRLRASCPVGMERSFALWLGRHALRAGFLHEKDGRRDLAHWLLINIPETQLWPQERLRLQTKLMFPGFWSIGKGLKVSLHRATTALRHKPTNIETAI